MPGRYLNLPEMPDELSLFRGGLFYKLQVLMHLARGPKLNLGRSILWSLIICWLPLVLITAAVHPRDLSGLLTDYLVYSRIVIAIPVLLAGQHMMEDRFRIIVMHVRDAGFVAEGSRRDLDRVIRILVRLRDSPIPEVLILLLVVGDLTLIGPGKVSVGASWAAARAGQMVHVTAAGWYYLFVSVSAYQFLVVLCLWKWALWVFFLFELSRMDLNLIATHPDRTGGLEFLGLAPIAFIPIASAVSIAIGGTWRQQMLHEHARLASFWLPAAILVALVFMFELGPLCFFIPKLALLRKWGKVEYGALAQTRVTRFHERWILNRDPQGETEFVPGAAMLADLGVSYGNIQRMKIMPVDKPALICLALGVLVPLFPVVLVEIPIYVILKALFQAVAGAPI